MTINEGKPSNDQSFAYYRWNEVKYS